MTDADKLKKIGRSRLSERGRAAAHEREEILRMVERVIAAYPSRSNDPILRVILVSIRARGEG